MGHHGNSFLSFGVAPVGEVGGWIELGRTTLGSNNANITVSSLADKRYYMILEDYDLTGAGTGGGFRLGNSFLDSGSNYARRISTDGAADVTSVNQTEMNGNGGFTAAPEFWVKYIANLSAKEKLAQSWRVFGFTGAGNAPRRVETVAKWVNTSNPLDIVGAFQGGADQFATGSEIVVLGWDPADTHTTNFWELLADVDLSTGVSNNLSSGTITAKKYLWIQCYIEPVGTVEAEINCNNDFSSIYAMRNEYNGATDNTFASLARYFPWINSVSGTGFTTPTFFNLFCINNSSNEKLFVMHNAQQNTAGSGNSPNRGQGVGKWANTSEQITEIEFTNSSAGNYGKESFLKVWGSN